MNRWTSPWCVLFGMLLLVVASARDASASIPAKATLDCDPGCNASLDRITITKNGQPIGEILSMGCSNGGVDTTTVKLAESGANDLHVLIAFIECSDTPVGTTGCDVTIPAGQEPWGVKFGVDALGNATCEVIGAAPEAEIGVAGSTLTFEFLGAVGVESGSVSLTWGRVKATYR